MHFETSPRPFVEPMCAEEHAVKVNAQVPEAPDNLAHV